MKIKKLTTFLVAALLLLSLVGCGGPEAETQDNSTPQTTDSSKVEEKTTFKIGETWVVDGQWELTVTSVTETKERNEFADTTPAAVYIVDYTYKNINYTDASGLMDGLFFNLDDTIVDNSGKMGYSYPGELTVYAKETPVGATCDGQVCVGVDNEGDFKITVTQYDSNSVKQQATFDIKVD